MYRYEGPCLPECMHTHMHTHTYTHTHVQACTESRQTWALRVPMHVCAHMHAGARARGYLQETV